MLIVRGTKKLRDRVKTPLADDQCASSTALGDWFGTVLFGKPNLAMFVNTQTFLPVFMTFAPGKTLMSRLPEAIATVLKLHGVDASFITNELKEMSDVRIAPTNNRQVLGVMNEYAFQAEHCDPSDLESMSLRVADVIIGPLMKTHGTSADALQAFVGATASEPLAEVLPFPPMTQVSSTHSEHAEHLELVQPPRQSDSNGDATVHVLNASVDDALSASQTVYQLKITLNGTKPPVWRRVVVDSSITLGELHSVIQAAFGWWNAHLHEFEINRKYYGTVLPDMDFGQPPIDEHATRLDTVVSEGSGFWYTYDFGDDWRHKIVVEKVVPADDSMSLPDCIGGKRACPPEDCGGVGGFQDMLDAISFGFDVSPGFREGSTVSFDPEDADLEGFAARLAMVSEPWLG